MQHTRIIIHYEKMGFIPEMQDWFNIDKLINITPHINKLIKNNQSHVHLDAKKSFYRIQNTFMLRTLSKQK